MMPKNASLNLFGKSFYIYLGQRKQWLSGRQILTHPFGHLSLVELVHPGFCWQPDLFLPQVYSWVWWHHYLATTHPWPLRNAWPPPWSDAPQHVLAKVQPVKIKNILLKRSYIKIIHFIVNIYFLIITIFVLIKNYNYHFITLSKRKAKRLSSLVSLYLDFIPSNEFSAWCFVFVKFSGIISSVKNSITENVKINFIQVAPNSNKPKIDTPTSI